MDDKLQGPLDTSYNVEWTKLVGVHLLALEQWAGNNFQDTSYNVEWTKLVGVHLLALEQWAGNNFQEFVLNIQTYINFI